VENLEEALGEGITTGHPDMPQFTLSGDEAQDLVVYLRTLQPAEKGARR
jgi:mono/diheme cytochrome c family protein